MKVGVIGAGPSGLACAYELQKLGYRVTVFEKDSIVGGRVRSIIQKDHVFNCGATMLIDADVYLLQLAKELNLENSILFKPVGCHIQVENKTYPVSNGVFGFFKFKQVSFLTRCRLFFWIAFATFKGKLLKKNQSGNHFWSALKPIQDFYLIDAESFLKKHFDDYTIQLTIGAICTSITLLKLSQITLQDLLDIFEIGRNKRCFFFRHGITTICKSLAQNLDVRLSCSVDQILFSNNKIQIKTLNQLEEFDRIVFAIPAPQVISIYPEAFSIPAIQSSEDIVTLRLAFLVPLLPFTQYDFVIFPVTESKMITGFNCSESVYKVGVDKITEKTEGVCAVCIRDEFSRNWYHYTDEEIFNFVKEELCRLRPCFQAIKDRMKPFHLEKWKFAVPISKPEHIQANQELWKNRQGERGVYFSGDHYNFMWVEGALRIGREIAKTIHQDDHS